jgi:hypothetical protein
MSSIAGKLRGECVVFIGSRTPPFTLQERQKSRQIALQTVRPEQKTTKNTNYKRYSRTATSV